jgi:hypothetical protein
VPDDIVMVPVPANRLQEVYALLARSPEAGNGREPASGARAMGPRTEALIRRAYTESPPAMLGVWRYLADHPDQVVTTEQIAAAINRTRNQLGGVLGAFGHRWASRYRQRDVPWPFEARWNDEQHTMTYLMPRQVAEIINATP